MQIPSLRCGMTIQLCGVFLLFAASGVPCVAQAQGIECKASIAAPTPEQVAQDKRTATVAWRLQQLVAAKKLPEAQAAAKSAMAEYTQSAFMAYSAGQVSWMSGDVRVAVEAYNRALADDPCLALAHYASWRVREAAGDSASAWQQLEMANRLASYDTSPANVQRDAAIYQTWIAVREARTLAAQAGAPKVQATPQAGFLRKMLNCGGIDVRSSAAVSDAALYLACGKIDRLLANRADVRKRLDHAGAELHIVGERENVSDLPENAFYRGGQKNYTDADGKDTNIDERTRGVGGLMSSCGEENLLHLPTDRYKQGEDICTHEFAHEVMNVGLSGKEREAIVRQYRASLAAGLWKGAYAAVNEREFWADISMWYFGSHGQYVPGQLQSPGPESLRLYDSGAYALLVQVYGPAPEPEL